MTNWMEKLGRAIFEAPFCGEQLVRDAPGMAEIRVAVLDEARARTHRVAGREVFPYNVVKLLVRGVGEEQAGVFRGAFFRQLLEQELREGLGRVRVRFPADLHIEVQTTAELPGTDQQWLAVQVESREAPPAPVAAGRTGRLVVVRGQASQPEVLMEKARTNIGRPVEVFKEDGPSRVNDLAFTADSEINRTVSREHAHVLFHKQSGEYRIYNDRYAKGGNCGLWIMRDGLSQEVHRTARGARLEHGDEIHLGSAVLRFQLDGPLREG
ncbi:MAG: FHA domain-containing protein [Bryobacteraceae bacterium]